MRGAVAVITNKNNTLLELKNVKKHFPITSGFFRKVTGYVRAVDGVTLDVKKGETLGIVGESGCGKTTLGKTILRLCSLTGGEIRLKAVDSGEMKGLQDLDKRESFEARRRIQMVFQNPYASLNPMKNILSAFDEPMKIHSLGNKQERKNKIAEMLETVNLQPDYMYRFPHEFSGGQQQRISIAKALAMNPEVIVCDEPVSALDVSIQSQIMNLMRKLQKGYNLTYIFIAHDLSVVQYMSDRIAVMYLGKIVEVAEAVEFHNNCLHPYTMALLSAVPMPVVGAKSERIILKGDVPSPVNPPKGCKFHPRCYKCIDICKEKEPALKPSDTNPDHLVACHLR
ncbi:MAG: ATP-binding cassette domain-containing protein [Clostridiales bacterium]|nr:ATP-binding cassette domain-containing protein [Clostridiales bacterium]